MNAIQQSYVEEASLIENNAYNCVTACIIQKT